MNLAIEQMDAIRGEVFNVGGGPDNTLSIWVEFGPLLESLAGHPIPITSGDWRPGDQQVFIADIEKAARMLGWQPTGVNDGRDWGSV